MVYQWNRDKAATNLRKHGVDFADAVSVFSDDLAITIPDERFDEERFVTIGLDAFGRFWWLSTPYVATRFESSLLATQLDKNDDNTRRDSHGSRI